MEKTKQMLKEAKQILMREIKDQEEMEAALIAISEEKPASSVSKSKETGQYMKTNFNVLRSRFKPSRSNGISSVFLPEVNSNGENIVRIIDNPSEVEDVIIRRNIEHFGQSEGTPFTKGKIIEECGYRGVSKQSENLITGKDMEYMLESLGTGEQDILRTLNDGNNLPTINADLYLQVFMNGFRKWREATSTSPSGRHLGHYKAILKAELPENNYDSEQEASATKNKRKIKNPLGIKIFEVLHHITMAAVRPGETLNRWKFVHSSMLEKDTGKPFLHRLRVIHIYEADYNLVLKLL